MQVYARTDLSEELTGPLFKFLAHGTEMLRIVHGSIFPRKSAVANPHQIMQISVGFGCRFASAEFRADYSNVKKKKINVLRTLLQIHSFSSKICNNFVDFEVSAEILQHNRRAVDL